MPSCPGGCCAVCDVRWERTRAIGGGVQDCVYAPCCCTLINHQPSSGQSTATCSAELMLNQLAKHSLPRTAKPLLYLIYC